MRTSESMGTRRDVQNYLHHVMHKPQSGWIRFSPPTEKYKQKFRLHLKESDFS
jgi:hypothetical protein